MLAIKSLNSSFLSNVSMISFYLLFLAWVQQLTLGEKNGRWKGQA